MDLNDLKCPKCRTPKSYIADFDSFYCESCNDWLEDICNDRECLFCRTRPLTPKEINDQKN